MDNFFPSFEHTKIGKLTVCHFTVLSQFISLLDHLDGCQKLPSIPEILPFSLLNIGIIGALSLYIFEEKKCVPSITPLFQAKNLTL